MQRTWLRWAGAFLALSLVGAACGSDRKTDTNAGGGASTTEKKAVEGGFGDMESPCGKGDAKGATEQGVTDTKISIGYGDDAGFSASKGLNHEIGDAVGAFVKWCNGLGGINGRQVEGKYYDAKLTEVNNVMLDACKTQFMLVGEGFALDSQQEEARLGCDLPAVPAYSVSAEFANAPLMVQPVPNPIDLTPVQIAASMAKKFPDKVKKTAAVFANYAATIDTKDKVLVSYPPFGFEFLPCPQSYNILGEPSYKPFVTKLKDCGAEVLYFTGTPNPNLENFLEDAAQLEYKPIIITDANFYDLAFAKWNVNGYADNVYVREAYAPLDETSNKAVKKYLDIVKGDGGDVSQLGEQAASAFLLWASAAKACGSTLTRDCVLKQLAKIDKWTGGGLHAETNPTKNEPPQCGLVLKMEGTKYVRFDPTEEGKFDCSPDYVKKVTGAVVDRAQLGPDRVSTKFQKK